MIDGITTEMQFYSRARSDGLVKRVDTYRKVLHYFTEREDRLVYRSATYDATDVFYK